MSLETEQGAAYQKSLRVQNAVRLAKMTPEDDRLLGLLFASCAKATGGEHEARRGDSINEATLLSMTAEHTPQTIHADDVVQSLAIIYTRRRQSALKSPHRRPSPGPPQTASTSLAASPRG